MDNGQQPRIDTTLGPKRKSPRSKRWIFTWNNPGDARLDLSTLLGLKYGVYQLEQGEQGTPHLQGYLVFATDKSRKQLSVLLGGNVYLDVARGTAKQCRDYCTKSDGRLEPPVEFGTMEQGKRTDLLELRDAVLSGRGDADILCDDHLGNIFMRHPYLTQRIRFIVSKPRNLSSAPFVTLCLGRPGTGKSHWARTIYPDAYHKPPNKWWEAYSGEREVIFDDFNGSHCSFTDFKLALDKGPYLAEVKGSSINIEAHTFIITSNHHPSDWYATSVYGQHGLEAVLRRISRLLYFTALGVFEEIPDIRGWLEEHSNSFE